MDLSKRENGLTIKWQRSEEGYCDSHDGRWAIVPLCCGTTRPQYYDLYDMGKHGNLYIRVVSFCDTQKECKNEAESLTGELQ